MPIGFGIIGCGMIADFHARALADVRGATLIGCYDQIPTAAERFAKSHGCRAYASLKKLLADPAIAAVSIATPSGAHMEPAVAAAGAGKHVVVEKPLEITLKRCDRIIKACDEAGVKLATIFPSRFHNAPILLKRAIEAGRFGDLTMGDAYVKWWRTQAYYDSGAWRGTWALDGGGALMNQAIHSVDLLTWLMGPVQEIRAIAATLAHERIEVEDTAMASLRFKNGALGCIEATTAAYPGYLKRIEIHGTEGSAVIEEEDIKVWDFARKTKSDRAILEGMKCRQSRGGGASDPAAIGYHGHTALFKNFVASIQTNRSPAVDGLEGRRSVEIILAIYRAAESGRTVTLPLAHDPKLAVRKSGQWS
ncbi:MAG: Gfo/Idh/MocA family oxidoreductase [Pirellulales bacterium]|nr:Gfo/Idh/MocA family oxidoreductase [Pirellulales bacterium]